MKDKILQNIANRIVQNLCMLRPEEAHSVFVDVREQMQRKHEIAVSVLDESKHKEYLKTLYYESRT